jgi:transketolase
MAAGAKKTDNLVAIIDNKRAAGHGPIAERLPYGSIADKCAASDGTSSEIDGHDMGQIISALDASDEKNGRPKAIVAKTVKGKE